MWKKYMEIVPDGDLTRSAQENIRMVEVWKKELMLSPSSSRKKLIK
jgi:hypothetical protein